MTGNNGDKDNAINVMFPEEIVKLSTGEQVEVRPVPFGKLKIFSGAVTTLLEKVRDRGTDVKDIKDWGELFNVAFEEIVSVMMIVLGKDREWFDNITISDGLSLLNKIVEQNYNEDTKKNIIAAIRMFGITYQTQSSSLSDKDTDGKT